MANKIALLLVSTSMVLSCERPPVTTEQTSAENTSETIVAALNLSLVSASKSPQVGQKVSWRPVFAAPDVTEAAFALTDNAGRLFASPLLPGVRYLFSTVFAGHTVQQWYQVPVLPSKSPAEAWQWVLADKRSLQQLSSDLPLKPQRLHYLPGAAPLFRSALARAATQMEILPLNLKDLRSPSDLVWWVNGDFEAEPALLASATRDAIEAFVFKGGRLVINGEWAGMQSPLREQTQALGQRLGVLVSQDTLAQTDTRLRIENIHRHGLTSGVQALSLSRSGSVRVYNPGIAQELAFASAENYRIAGLKELKEQHTVLAIVPYGQGTIIAVGDSSLWSDSLFDQKDNRQLWENSLTFSKEAAEDASVKPP